MHSVDNDVEFDAALSESVARVVGTPRPEVDQWGMMKKARDGSRYNRCEHSDGAGLIVRVWPLSELSVESVRDRWGAGEYKACWFHGQVSKGNGLVFRIEESDPVRVRVPPAAPPPAAPPHALAGIAPELAQTFHLMSMFDQRANESLTRTLQAAAAMSHGGGGGGLDAATMLTFLERSEARTERLLTAMDQRHADSIKALQASLVDEPEQEGPRTSKVIQSAAEVAKPFMRKGQGFREAVVNHLKENPADLFDTIKSVPAVFAQLAQLMQSHQAAQAAAPPPPPPTMPEGVRPRARLVEREPQLPPSWTQTAGSERGAAVIPAEPETSPAPVAQVVTATKEAAAE